jgi:hypothetical protein
MSFTYLSISYKKSKISTEFNTCYQFTSKHYIYSLITKPVQDVIVIVWSGDVEFDPPTPKSSNALVHT